jgi:DNA-binding response OmpR family regulator
MAKVLLADKSVTIQKVVELVLQDKDFELKIANSGGEAMAALDSFKPDIVLTDVKLEDINGYELAEKVRSAIETQNVPVLLITGAFDPIDEELREKSGADDSIIKPFEADDLLGKINTLLEKRSEAAEAEAEEIEEEVSEVEEVVEVVGEELEGEVDESLLSLAEFEEEPEEVEVIEEISEEEVEFVMPGGEEMEAEAIEEEAVTFVEEAEAIEEEAVTFVEAAAAPETRVPGAEEMLSIFSEAVNQRLSEIDVKVMEAAKVQLSDTLSATAFKDDFLATLAPDMKQSIDKLLWEIAPEMTEKIIKETVSESLVSLKEEIQNIIWETVPELAESIIKETIEQIRANS